MPDKFKYGGMDITYQQQTGNIHELYIYDDVTERGPFNWKTWEYEESETSAKHFRDVLAQIPETDEIVCYINSNGGSVKEGVSIYNQLARHKAKKICYVDGFANSVASLIAMSFDEIVMGLGTSMLIHEMWMNVSGNAAQLRKAADDLDDLMSSNRQVYLNRSGGKITEEQLQELMEKEKYLTPEECMQYGFCDRIDSGRQAESGQMQQMLKNTEVFLQYQMRSIESLRQNIRKMEIPSETLKGGTENKAYEKAAAFFKILGGR